MRLISQALLSLPCLAASARLPPTDNCKAYPGTAGWPSPQAWAELNESLDGRLLTPTPPAAACHSGHPLFNLLACAAATKGWTSYEWHSRDPVSMIVVQYTNDTCLPDPKAPCSAQGYPAYVVNATTAEHIKLGIAFAREHNIRLVVKSTGHDFIGRSNAPGSLSIWVRHLNEISYHAGEFTLSGSGKVLPGDAVTVGGGTHMYDIYQATAKYKQTVVGGGAKSVSVGGYISGGGHSVLSQRYGMAADQVLEMEVVTPQGEILKVNEDQNTDLFWALRGGGGSTFGVVTSVTLRTVPSPKITAFFWLVSIKAKSPSYGAIISYIISQLPTLMDAGLSGYGYIAYQFPNPIPIPGLSGTIDGFVGSGVLQDKSVQELNNIFKPLKEALHEKWPGEATLFNLGFPYDSFLSWFSANYDKSEAGNHAYVVSRLLDKETLAKNTSESNKAFLAPIPITGGYAMFMVGGKGIHEAKPRGGSNAVNPAWRKAYVHTLAGASFPAFNNTARLEAIDKLQKSFQPIRDMTPDSGAYINEV
ncbi:hypothetical protein QQS21_009851 [Conoideocrella luteorostrata]|uniref:FAD-binding PCMH-type domain-containing protein n=1 Tax=Conoideocrella luteorostrata TaxID=1105319 RepID=A0AAJ0CGF0_9HYPO|nr:hypothetical protein QQS21_009851 [Conoideocrella luteorostrata]